jgi:hypothetical protein
VDGLAGEAPEAVLAAARLDPLAPEARRHVERDGERGVARGREDPVQQDRAARRARQRERLATLDDRAVVADPARAPDQPRLVGAAHT